MDISRFLNDLLHELSQLDFIDNIDINFEIVILKGRIYCKRDSTFIEVYFNEQTGTEAFALNSNGKRIWGIDFDNIRGWHEHPEGNPDDHKLVSAKDVAEIIKRLAEIYLLLNDNNGYNDH